MSLIDKIMNALNLYDEEEYEEEEEIVEQKPRKTVRPQGSGKADPKRETMFAPKPTAFPRPSVKETSQEAPFSFKSESEAKPAVREQPDLFESSKPKQPEAKPAVREEKKEESTGGFFSKRFGRKGDDKPGSRTISLPIENRMLNVVVITPASFDDSVKIADYLRTSQPVVVNFEHTDAVVAKRMTDYISGTVYALGGTMKKINRYILICAPKNVDIDAGVMPNTEGDFK